MSPPKSLYQWSQIIAGLGTVALTAFLVILYKRQQEQLEAEHKAILEVVNYEWNGDQIEISLSNYGNGVAKDIFLGTLVHVNTGEHRKYAMKWNKMKRQDKSGEWSSIIQSGEEEVPFTGRSKVGMYIPDRNRHVGIKFSEFVRRVRKGNENATELKYRHVVRGSELSGKSCTEEVQWAVCGTNPQQFGAKNSLEDMPNKFTSTNEDIFRPYLQPSRYQRYKSWVYTHILFFLNWVVPKKRIEPRTLDASGLKRVKHIFIRDRIKNYASEAKERLFSE